LNKIISIKKTSSIFLATVLVLGTIAAISPSFMVGAAAQIDSYYDGMDNNYKKSAGKDVSVKSIKCNNINVNVNGLELTALPSSLSNLLTNEEADGSASSYGSGIGSYDDGQTNSQGNFKFICINNNNNTFVGVDDEEPTPPKATLNVTKNVTCTYIFGAVVPELACELLEDRITENQFLIEVTDDNPVPSQFPGSESGTIVTLGAGNYVVSEIPDVAAIEADIVYLVQQFEAQSGGTEYTITPQVSFTGDCTDVNPNNPESTEATGTIGAGESQTCNIENHFTITAVIS